MDKDTASIISLLSLLQEKGILDKSEVREVHHLQKVVPELVKRGIITEEEFIGQTGSVREIMKVCRRILQGGPVLSEEIEKLTSYRKNFPKLIEILMGEILPAHKEN